MRSILALHSTCLLLLWVSAFFLVIVLLSQRRHFADLDNCLPLPPRMRNGCDIQLSKSANKEHSEGKELGLGLESLILSFGAQEDESPLSGLF